MQKYFASILIIFVILLNFFAAPVFAEVVPFVTVGSANGVKGDIVEIPVVLSGNTGFSNLSIEIEYDAAALTLTNVVAGTGTGATFTRAQYYTKNPFNMSWDSTKNTAFNGTLATLTFEVIATGAGTYPIKVSYYRGRGGTFVDGDNVNYDEFFEPLGLVYVSGKIEIRGNVENSIILGNDLRASLTGETATGKVYAAIYKGNHLKQVKVYSPAEELDVVFDSPQTGDIVKVMWWKDDFQPMCEAKSITIP